MSIWNEGEASEKWCPFVRRAGDYGDLSLNRDAKGGATTASQCIGEICMAWRWAYADDGETIVTDGNYPLGYCGLAGKPSDVK